MTLQELINEFTIIISDSNPVSKAFNEIAIKNFLLEALEVGGVEDFDKLRKEMNPEETGQLEIQFPTDEN